MFLLYNKLFKFGIGDCLLDQSSATQSIAVNIAFTISVNQLMFINTYFAVSLLYKNIHYLRRSN